MLEIVIICGLIVLGFFLNSLMDGIAFSKGNRDLKYLWHIAKYLCFATVVVFSSLFGYLYGSGELGIFKLLAVAGSIITGAIVWQIAYKIWRKIDWPDWA